MQAELAKLDPNAVPAELKDMMQGGALPRHAESCRRACPVLAAASFRASAGCRVLAVRRSGAFPDRGRRNDMPLELETERLRLRQWREDRCRSACALLSRSADRPRLSAATCDAQRCRGGEIATLRRALGSCAASACGRSRTRHRGQLRRLCRPVVSRGLGRSRDRLGHRAANFAAAAMRREAARRARDYGYRQARLQDGWSATSIPTMPLRIRVAEKLGARLRRRVHAHARQAAHGLSPSRTRIHSIHITKEK